jgi:hypothetical protein
MVLQCEAKRLECSGRKVAWHCEIKRGQRDLVKKLGLLPKHSLVVHGHEAKYSTREEKRMAGLGHLGVGFAVKPLAPKIPLGVLLVATEVPDILWAAFYVTGIDRSASMNTGSPMSHGLFMSVVWATIAALLAALIYRDRRSGAIIGLLVLSHWVVDLITHPMGAIFGGSPLPADLPLFFNGSPKVGFGLYNHSFAIALATDLGMLILGVIVYSTYVRRRRTLGKNGVAQ